MMDVLAQTAASQPAGGGLTETITKWAEAFIGWAGYTGSAILMALESMIAPVPSEAVMPFVGVKVHQGEMNLYLALLATTIGSLVGSLISYWLGYVGGKPLVMKVGRFLFINEHHLDLTIAWFHKRGGSWTVFIARFIPVVRHFISIPAGMGKMPLVPFCIVTIIGATMWNAILLYVGYQWSSHLDELKHYYKILDKIVIVVGVLGVAAWFYIHWRKPAPKKTEAPSQPVPERG